MERGQSELYLFFCLLLRKHWSGKVTIPCIDEIAESGEEDSQIMRVENKMLLHQALIGLSPEQREVIILRIYEELKYTEIAKILGCNLSTVKSRYFQGIKKLDRLLEN